MSFRNIVVAVCTVTALGSLAAPSWSAEQVLSTAQLNALIVGRTVSLEDEGRATYETNGRYTFRGNRTWRGRYSISSNRVCVVFDNGNRRCDHYVRNGKSYYFINAAGGRWKVTIR